MKKHSSSKRETNLELKSRIFITPLEKQAPGPEFDGSQGRYRARLDAPRTIQANTDLEAIDEWLEVTTKHSSATRRCYRKEVERLLAWAIVERQKPISSLDVIDMRAYKTFLTHPVSAVGATWTAHERYDALSQSWVPITTDEQGKTVKKRFQRTDPDWKPFDGPLSPTSVSFALRVLKCFFNYLTQNSYLQFNPMVLQNNLAVQASSIQVTGVSRSLDMDTWKYVMDFIQDQRNTVPENQEDMARDRLYWIRTWNRNQIVFATLYLLGVRISELQGIKMSDFQLRKLKHPHTGEYVTSWWVSIFDNSNRQRVIPVPDQLVLFIQEYRRTLNDFPSVNKANSGGKSVTERISEELGADDSTLIRNLSGNLEVSTNRLQVSIKQVLSQALAHLKRLQEEGTAPPNVDEHKLEHASAQWLRYTSASHQRSNKVSESQIHQAFGYLRYDTARIIRDEDEALRVAVTRNFKTD